MKSAVDEVIDDMKFEEHLKKLSELPDWKKAELWKKVKDEEFGLGDLTRIFDVHEGI